MLSNRTNKKKEDLEYNMFLLTVLVDVMCLLGAGFQEKPQYRGKEAMKNQKLVDFQSE
jgi:hypothetical protein